MPERRAPVWLRSVEAAATAGLVFAVLALVARALVARLPDPRSGDRAIAEWYADPVNQDSLLTAINLHIISVIAFLWFVAVVRRRVGERENRFFGTVFLGAALLLCGVWLLAGTLVVMPAMAAQLYDIEPASSQVALTHAGAVTLDSVVATRLEAVFVISATSVGRLSKAFPTWITVTGYALGAIMLLAAVPNEVLTWVFPIWVSVVSATMFFRRRDLAAESEAVGTHPRGSAA